MISNEDIMKLQNGSDVRGVAVAGKADEPVTLFPEAANRIVAGFAAFLAKKLGNIVSTELFSTDDIQKTLKEIVSAPTIKDLIGNKLEAIIYEKLPNVIPMIAMFLSPELVNKIKNALTADIDKMLRELMDEVGDKLNDVLDINSIVENKVNNFSCEKLETILFEIMKKEFKFIEIIGAVLGFIIGIAQVVLTMVA